MLSEKQLNKRTQFYNQQRSGDQIGTYMEHINVGLFIEKTKPIASIRPKYP